MIKLFFLGYYHFLAKLNIWIILITFIGNLGVIASILTLDPLPFASYLVVAMWDILLYGAIKYNNRD